MLENFIHLLHCGSISVIIVHVENENKGRLDIWEEKIKLLTIENQRKIK